MNYSKLRGKIREVFGTQEAFADALGMSCGALSMRLNNKTNWTLDELSHACEVLAIPDSEIGEYFFRRKVR